jgi:hypothetical protein
MALIKDKIEEISSFKEMDVIGFPLQIRKKRIDMGGTGGGAR